MGMRLVIRLRPFALIILVTPLDTEGNIYIERVRGGWRRVGVERRQERKGQREWGSRRRRSRRRSRRTEGRS